MERKPPVAIVGLGVNGLGIIRSFAKENVPIIKIDKNCRRPGALSRYGKYRSTTVLSGEKFIEELKQILQEFGPQVVLFLTEEETVKTVSEYRQDLAGLCRIVLPTHDTLLKLMTKKGFDELAEKQGLLRPKTVAIKQIDDVEMVRSFRFPCILKPGCKNSEYGDRFKKGYKVDSIDEIENLCQMILPVLPDLVVQEWIEGGDSEIYFSLQYIDINGVLVSSFTGRKLRSWPLPVGGTASCMPARDEHIHLSEITHEFFKVVGCVGMCSMEYKKDVRDGLYYAVEPTVSRTDFQHEVSTLNGINILYHSYLSVIGENVNRNDFKNAVSWHDPITEKWSREMSGVSDEELHERTKKVSALFRWDDPHPWIYSVYRRIKAKLGVD